MQEVCISKGRQFFSKSKLTLQKWLILLYWWVRQYPVTDAAEAKIDPGTAVDAYRWLCEVCSTKLLRSRIQLGGNGIVVQVDESLFRHKPKVIITAWLPCFFRMQTISLFTASQRKNDIERSVGLRYGGYQLISSIGIHGDCTPKRCYHSTPNHTGSHFTWHRHPL